MAKALYGTAAAPSQVRLLDEIRSLRQRVAELEAALEDAHSAASERQELAIVMEETAGVGA